MRIHRNCICQSIILVILTIFYFQPVLGKTPSSNVSYQKAFTVGRNSINNRKALTIKFQHEAGYDYLYIRFKGNESALAIFQYTPDGELLKKSRYKVTSFEEWLQTYEQTHFTITEMY